MAKVLISGYYGFSNAGDEAMLTAIVDSLKREAPDTVITVISGHPRSTCALHDVKSIGRFDFPPSCGPWQGRTCSYRAAAACSRT